MTEKKNGLRYSSKKFAFTMFSLWLISIILSIAAATNFFKENPFNDDNFQLKSFFHFVPTFIMLVVVINYFKNRGKEIA